MRERFDGLSSDDALAKLGVSRADGLADAEAAKRLVANGRNELAEKKPKSRVRMFFDQLNDVMIYILFASAVVSVVLGEYADAIIILAVVLLNAIVGMVQEGKAQEALAALKKLSSPTAMVRRGGRVFELPAAELVAGDVVVLEAGRMIPADLRLVTSVNLKIEESALTGESVPVEKDAGFVAEGDVPLGDRLNMAYMSTTVTYGRGEGVVAATGMDTEIGKIATMINAQGDEQTPLQRRLADLGKILGIVAVAVCALLFVVALIQGRDIFDMLLTAISLAVAAVPEGLPAIVTIVLALGVQRMVKVNTIVRRLPSVETLGSVSVVCSDKTGTLTQNRMTVVSCYTDGKTFDVSDADPAKYKEFMRGFVLCNDAEVRGADRIGDPTELALIDLGLAKGLDRLEMEKTMPRVGELAFDSGRKMMTTLHDVNGEKVSYTKGATDVIMRRCVAIMESGRLREITDADRAAIEKAAHDMSSRALRVLALAERRNTPEATEEKLCFVGLVGMIDPPRPEAADAVEIFKGASVRTVMITGDHRDTAFAIAHDLGIADSEEQCVSGEDIDKLGEDGLREKIDDLRVFARVSPEHKVMIVSALRSKGYIVSMTGDGVNDAPSLKAADIGVAMGQVGTDVAKSAADMVLTDDNFATIQKAIAEGRGIYTNIKKSVLFLLSSNFGEIITMFLSILCGLAAPLKAIHILWVNMITDSLPALSLGVDPKDRDIMKYPPRSPKESLFAGGGYFITLFYGAMIALVTLGGFVFAPLNEMTAEGIAITIPNIAAFMAANPFILAESQTYAFTILGLSQLFHAIGMRNVDRSIFRMNHLENKLMILSFFLGFALQIAVTEIPFLVDVFGTVQLSLTEWLVLTLASSVPLWLHEILVPIRKRLRKHV